MGLLGFCLNFILLGRERDHWVHTSKRDDVLQERSRQVLCGCALWDCVPITSPPGALSPHLWGVGEGTLAHLSERRDRKSSCATQYHVILCRRWSLGRTAKDGVPSAGTPVVTVYSWENHGIPCDERSLPVFLQRRGSERFMGAGKAPWAPHTGHRAAAQHGY